MHIPKTGGTALDGALRDALTPAEVIRGFDRSLFGGFHAFETMTDFERDRVFSDPAYVPRSADLVVAHMAFSTLRAAYPSGQLVAIFREPCCRLLSHWSYWRTRPDPDLVHLGAWGDVVRGARASLADFLNDPRAACQTDNVATRMLLWPHPLIPEDGFIDPRHDETLVQQAMARLDDFSLVDVVESPGRAALQAWLGHKLQTRRANETPAAPAGSGMTLSAELTPEALDRLDSCSRLDLDLWRRAASAWLEDTALERIRSHALLVAAARHATLLGAGLV